MQRRGVASRALLGFAALLMLAGGTAHGLALHKAAAVIDAANLSKHYAAMFKGLWLRDAAVVSWVGLAYLMLALWPRLATKAALGVLGAIPLATAISIYSTVGNFAPADLLIACAVLVLIAALLKPGNSLTSPEQSPARAERVSGPKDHR